jgi:hypothetical protein
MRWRTRDPIVGPHACCAGPRNPDRCFPNPLPSRRVAAHSVHLPHDEGPQLEGGNAVDHATDETIRSSPRSGDVVPVSRAGGVGLVPLRSMGLQSVCVLGGHGS